MPKLTLAPSAGAGEDRNAYMRNTPMEADISHAASARVRIETPPRTAAPTRPSALAPGVGAGEDRHTLEQAKHYDVIVLAPDVGAGEDRNQTPIPIFPNDGARTRRRRG